MNYWKMLLSAMGGNGYVLAADLARRIGNKSGCSAAHPRWQNFCNKGQLFKYKKGNKQQSRVAYVLPGREIGFEKNYPDFKKCN